MFVFILKCFINRYPPKYKNMKYFCPFFFFSFMYTKDKGQKHHFISSCFIVPSPFLISPLLISANLPSALLCQDKSGKEAQRLGWRGDDVKR